MIEERTEEEVAASLEGRTITKVRWFDAAPGRQWAHHETCWLWLDDGRVIEFSSWGFDADGATIEEIEVRDIDVCAHCGESHADRRVVYPDNGPPLAYCTDRINRAWTGL